MKIHFIINPISGGKHRQKNIYKLAEEELKETNHQLTYSETKAAGHASELAEKAVLDKKDIVVAVGGDGTINEVGRALIGKKPALAIIPCGSGNGFARHFKIPLKASKAIQLLASPKIRKIDTAVLNGRAFLALAGVGFDAHIGHQFANYGSRGALAYFKISTKEFFRYKAEQYRIEVNGEVIESEAFSITVANTSQFGNNAYISPDSQADDGFLELCILKATGTLKALKITHDLFRKKLTKNPNMIYRKAKNIKVWRSNSGEIHLDGEPEIDSEVLDFSIQPLSLNLVHP